MKKNGTRWPDVVFETPYTWGDTRFMEEETLLEGIWFLSEILGWHVDASECRQWVHQGNGKYRPVLSYGKEFTFSKLPSVIRLRLGEWKGEWEPDGAAEQDSQEDDLAIMSQRSEATGNGC